MISFVYFDVGGVIIKDFSASNKWQEMERDLGITPDKKEKFIQFWDKYKNAIGIDQDIDLLIPELSSKLDLKLPEDYSWLTDFINRFEQNRSIWSVINSTKTKYKIGLLTGMYPRMLDAIKAANLLPPIEWDVIVDSSVVKLQKPDPAIYQLAEVKAGVKPEEILFVDNVEKNLVPAKARGWQTFFYDSTNYEQSTQKLADFLQKEIKS